MKSKRKIKNISVILLAIVVINFFSKTSNAITKSVNINIDNELISYGEDINKNNFQDSVENSNTKNLEWENFYEQTSQLVKEEWSENYFNNIELNLNDNSVVIDNCKTNYNLENLKSYVENHKDDIKSFNSDTENEDNLLPISDILNVIGAEITKKDEKIIINDFGNNVELSVDSSDMKLNNSQYNLKSELIEYNGEIMASKDILTDGLGIEVNYDKEDNVISLERPFQTMRLIVKLKNKKINLDKYKIVKTIISPDNVAILQFNSIIDTKLCYEELKNNKDVEYVEPDMYIVNNDDIIEEENLESSLNEKKYSYKSWGAKHIESDKYEVYLNNKDESNNVTVAVVDSGVALNHSFLKDRILDNGYDFIYKDKYPYDDNGHGTHVAGTIVDNTQGLDVKILPIKVLNAYGRGTTINVANGIKYSVDNGADIINFSIYMDGHAKIIDDRITEAINKNVTVVVCAGNFNADTATQCPSHLKNAIVVSAIDSLNNKAYFSNYGESVDVAAPGVKVYSSYLNGGYAYMSGTSMATPHIAAVAAMYKLDNPSLTPLEIENKIKNNTYDIGEDGFDKYFGHGVPKLSKAIPNIPLESLILNETEIKLFKKQEFDLSVSYNPTNTTELKNVTWTTSNDKVARVNNGKVMSVGLGEATITAKVGEKTASCVVTVEQSEIINIPDKNLRKLINQQLGNENDSEISITEMLTITEVAENYTEIESLEGLQYATNLKTISFNYGNVSDISCFENIEMKKLRELNLYCTKIKDISIFKTAKFPELYYLNISGNCISDLSPLGDLSMPKLSQQNLFVSNQKIILDSVDIEEGDIVQIDNPARDTNGNIINNITHTDGIYNKENHKITWDNINESKTISFRFEGSVKISGISKIFYGTVSIPVKVDEVIVGIPDKNLKKVLNSNLYKEPDEEITKAELKKISYLDASNKGISNLEGLQYAKNLSNLYLDGNNISNFSILEQCNLQNLQLLNISRCNLADIDWLDNLDLTNLKYLNLSENEISNIDIFSNISLPNLTEIDISNNKLTNIDSLASASLPNLSTLYAYKNMICDISSFELENIPNLTQLFLNDQQIILDDKKVKFDGRVEIINPIKSLTGKFITDISVKDGKYDLQANKIIWNNIKENSELTYEYYCSEDIGKVYIVYSGKVYLSVIIEGDKEDVNNDNVIDEKDLNLVAKYYNVTINDNNWRSEFDLNNDGIIDIYDYIIISKKI